MGPMAARAAPAAWRTDSASDTSATWQLRRTPPMPAATAVEIGLRTAEQRDVRARGGERAHDCGAYAAAGAGNEGMQTRERT